MRLKNERLFFGRNKVNCAAAHEMIAFMARVNFNLSRETKSKYSY